MGTRDRNAGPKVWQSSWMYIFYGYLMMQFVAIFLFGYFFHYSRADGWKGIMSEILSVTDLFCGYWMVGQYLIISPIIDMGCCNLKWKGWFKKLNLLVMFIIGAIMYGVLFEEDPHKSPIFQKIVNATEHMVYIGNFL